VSIPKLVVYVNPICQLWLENMLFIVADDFTKQSVFSIFEHTGHGWWWVADGDVSDLRASPQK